MKWTTEAKVGLFTVIGIVLFAMCIIFWDVSNCSSHRKCILPVSLSR